MTTYGTGSATVSGIKGQAVRSAVTKGGQSTLGPLVTNCYFAFVVFSQWANLSHTFSIFKQTNCEMEKFFGFFCHHFPSVVTRDVTKTQEFSVMH